MAAANATAANAPMAHEMTRVNALIAVPLFAGIRGPKLKVIAAILPVRTKPVKIFLLTSQTNVTWRATGSRHTRGSRTRPPPARRLCHSRVFWLAIHQIVDIHRGGGC